MIHFSLARASIVAAPIPIAPDQRSLPKIGDHDVLPPSPACNSRVVTAANCHCMCHDIKNVMTDKLQHALIRLFDHHTSVCNPRNSISTAGNASTAIRNIYLDGRCKDCRDVTAFVCSTVFNATSL